MESTKPNEKLANFISSLRAGGLLKLMESNRAQVQDKCGAMSTKIKQLEEAATKNLLIMRENSHLIEKFQNQLQIFSNQNSELLEKQNELKEENFNLKNQLQCSENKFAELDIVYDEQISASFEKIIALENQLAQLNDIQDSRLNQFDHVETELHQNLANAEKLNADLEERIQNLTNEHKVKEQSFYADIENAKMLNVALMDKIRGHERKIEDLKEQLDSVKTENREISELKDHIEKLNSNGRDKETEYINEKKELVKANQGLKMTIDDLKKQSLTKEKEMEDVYLKFQQLSKFVAGPYQHSIASSNYTTRKRTISKAPKPLQNSSDSENSSMSLYQGNKRHRISTETDEENLFGDNDGQTNNNLFDRLKANKVAPLMRRKRQHSDQTSIEIPESSVVSSSALSNLEPRT